MYPSDYGYGVLSSNCARTTCVGSYGIKSCGGLSWLYGKGEEWTLMSDSSDLTRVFSLYTDANLGFSFSYDLAAVRPVLYLDASVYKIDGEGTLDNPYIIGM